MNKIVYYTLKQNCVLLKLTLLEVLNRYKLIKYTGYLR